MIPPPDPQPTLSTRRQLELMRDLQRLATTRDEAETRVVNDHAREVAAIDERARAAAAAAEREFQQARSELEQRLAAERDELSSVYTAERSTAQSEYHGLRGRAEAERREAKDDARRRAHDEAWEILAVFDAQKGQPQLREQQANALLRNKLAEVQTIEQEAGTILSMRRMPTPEPLSVDSADRDGAGLRGGPSAEDPADGPPDVDAALADVDRRVDEVRTLATDLYHHRLTRLFEGLTPFGVVFGFAALAYAAAAATVGWASAVAVGVGAAAVALGAAGMWWSARPIAARGARERYLATQAAAAAARSAINAAAEAAQRRRREEAVNLIEKRNADLAALGYEIEQTLGETRLRVAEQLGSAGEIFPAKLTEMRQEHAAALAEIDARLTDQLARMSADHHATLAEIENRRRQEQQDVRRRRDDAHKELRDAWFNGYASIQAEAAAMRDACAASFPDWRTGGANACAPPGSAALAVEFGRATVDLARIRSGLSDDPRLRPAETTLELPTLVTLVDQPALVVTVDGDRRREATRLLQAMTLRWLVGQPAGKVRLTVLDPTGLGEGFASLMHLADYDENLIAGRIWTEGRDIDEQLLRLTTHLETVIQKYLRSEYESIHEYNHHAGEVAEPFQVLVVNGFPVNFSDAACRRLMNLAASGPRCGVYVMLAMDRGVKPPAAFRFDDLAANAVHLDWDGAAGAGGQKAGRFVWRYPAFEHLPLAVAEPPGDEQMVDIVRRAGEAAKSAIRVEVPFAAVAPRQDEPGGGALWQATCGDELRIPVGRAGANRLQDVRLGRGTSQHLLVAGKTGSGKSTFLHALVTSAALRYSPDELEFYLVDFKKGVEFKAYATHRLPHARVVAIESEREFGLSVLQRLDEELTRRGERYREAGVQSLADYRAARPDEPTPRLLLVIDEFQELFVEDDRLAQDATLLLDRLVRQGRAFGVHVLLGTQTLAGAYSLARSTLGQIAVRVALACSEADAHLILSDERNQAARFLSRPGEAIYNDQNGLVAANQPFQVVWLPDQERAKWLAEIDGQREQARRPATETIVFEGNTPAEIAGNHELQSRLAAGPAAGDARNQQPAVAYLGAAVAIKPPTAAAFGRHGGSNLLAVGADEQAAFGMLGAAVVSLGAADPAARFVVADGVRPGEPLAGAWSGLLAALPCDQRLVDGGGVASAIAEIADEVARRDAEDDHNAPPLYLVLNHAGRFRELRRSDDDFSFTIDKDQPPRPDKQLSAILRDGPGLGVHVLVWCDSYNTVTRLFDRATLREFAQRVAMPMSAADSSNLIDTPAAAHLNQHRALLYSDETGRTEKFRPYGPPSPEFLASLAGRLTAPPDVRRV